MATQDKDFKVKNGLQVGGPTNLVNYTSSSPSNPFIGQLWISASSLYAWNGSEWNLVGDGNTGTSPSGNFLTEESAASAYFRISSSVNNFGTIKTLPPTEDVIADLITDELTFAAENGIILNATASADKLTISTNATWNNTASAIVMRDGEQSFDITRIDFNTSLEPGFLEPGQLEWNVEEGTLDLGMSGSVVQSIGMESYFAPVKNNSGVLIPHGSIVMATGVIGDRVTIAKAVTNGTVGPEYIIGVATQDIPDGSEYGLVTTDGIVRDVNTASYAIGTILYPDPINPGGWTSTKPTSPAIKTSLAIVLRQEANTGRIYVRMDNGSVLGGTDSNVEFTTLSDNDIITYSQSSSYWTNQGLAAAIQEVDGEGSGIDADTLDSFHASYFINTSSATQIKEGNLNIHGVLFAHDLFVTGSTVYLNTTSLEVNDPVIYLGRSQYTSDILDIGFIAPYGDINSSSAAGQHSHTGLIRDHLDKKWKLLANADHPINDIFDFSSPSVTFATLVVNNIEVSSSAKSINLNAEFLDGYKAEYFQSAETASVIYLSKTDASNIYLGINNTANHAQTASSINWTGITDAPSFLTESTASSLYASNQDFNNLMVATHMGIY